MTPKEYANKAIAAFTAVPLVKHSIWHKPTIMTKQIFKRKITDKGLFYRIKGKPNGRDILVYKSTKFSPHLERMLKAVDDHGQANLPLTEFDIHEFWLHRLGKDGVFKGIATVLSHTSVFEITFEYEVDGIKLWLAAKDYDTVLEEICFFANRENQYSQLELFKI